MIRWWRLAAEVFLGVALDRNRNESAGGDRDLSSTGAPVRTLLVHARGDLEIAAEVRQILVEP
jgi:acetate kinase